MDAVGAVRDRGANQTQSPRSCCHRPRAQWALGVEQLCPVSRIACQNSYHPIFLLGIGSAELSVIIPLLPQ